MYYRPFNVPRSLCVTTGSIRRASSGHHHHQHISTLRRRTNIEPNQPRISIGADFKRKMCLLSAFRVPHRTKMELPAKITSTRFGSALDLTHNSRTSQISDHIVTSINKRTHTNTHATAAISVEIGDFRCKEKSKVVAKSNSNEKTEDETEEREGKRAAL